MSNGTDEPRGTPTEADVLSAVTRSGYLLDQEVATVLEDLGFHVQTSWPFEDPDEGESRELDVWAIRRFIDNGQPQLFVELFCECKSGEDRPFVFLTRRKGLIDQDVCPVHYIFPHEIYQQGHPNGGWTEIAAFKYFDVAKYHYWFKADQKAVQLAKIVRNKKEWEAQHDGLYNAILMPLAKAASHRAKMIREWCPLTLCFPIVVLKSPLYLIDSARKPLQVERVPHVSFFRRLDSSTVKGTYIVDFVTLDGLAEFIKQKVVPFAEEVAALARADPKRFLDNRPRI
jgi:hypothetical protein